MDLTSYADLAVRLVNTADPVRPDQDRLADLAALRVLLADRPQLRNRATRRDLEELRRLRRRLRAVFEAAAAGHGARAVEQLNGLLVQHPIHPQISGHDASDWHLHLTERGEVAERYAATAVMGLAVLVTTLGLDRLGVCEAPPCRNVFVDTSTNRSRRYCSDRCATRANVAAYRARKKEQPAPALPPS